MNIPEPGSWHNSPPKNDIEPGTFYDERVMDISVGDPSITTESEAETYESESLIKQFSLFRKTFRPKEDVIYYPCSNTDTSVSRAFSDSKVIYVDMDAQVVEVLKEKGLEAHAESALDFDPGVVDIVVLYNPQIDPDVPISHVDTNGYVLTNNYHSTAEKVRKNKYFKIKGVICEDNTGTYVDVENLEDYFTEIETDEEFQKAPRAFGSIDFETAKRHVKRLTGKTDSILVEYKKIIAEELEKSFLQWTELKKTDPEGAEAEGDPRDGLAISFNRDGVELVLPLDIPKKKGLKDTMFIFQKI